MKDSCICGSQGTEFERVLVSVLLSEKEKDFQGVGWCNEVLKSAVK